MAIQFVLDPDLTDALRAEIESLWCDVTNAGGAVGFVAPVTLADVRPMAATALGDVAQGHDRLVIGRVDGRLAAMLFVVSRRFALQTHWRTLKRVMVHPDFQGRGYGAAIMREAERVARHDGIEALHITVRGGLGLEPFYERLGYKEVGRLPGALRVGPDDDRDEIVFWRALR